MSLFSSLLFVGLVGLANCDLYYEVFDNEWPHCTNAGCFSSLSLSAMEDKCDANSACIGFSWNGNWGCLKQNVNCASNGFGTPSHGYYARDTDDSSLATGFVQVWDSIWPHCSNVGCYRTSEESMRIMCQKSAECIGFSWNGDWGCLKKDQGTCAPNGFGSGSHGYLAKAGSFCADGCGSDEFENILARQAEDHFGMNSWFAYLTNVNVVLVLLALSAVINIAFMMKRRSEYKSISDIDEANPLLVN